MTGAEQVMKRPNDFCCRAASRLGATLVIALALAISAPRAFAAGAAMAQAVGCVEGAGLAGGVCVVLGRPDAEFAASVAKLGNFVVHCLCADEPERDQLQRALRERRAYGSVSAAVLREKRLPYTDNLVNLVVVASASDLAQEGIAVSEIMRVLAPLGTACIGDPTAKLIEQARRLVGEHKSVNIGGKRWAQFTKPWPKDIDEWTHYLHGADGNAVAVDEVVGPPVHFQWQSGPKWLRSHETDSSLRTMVSSQGKLYYILDEAPVSLAGNHPLPDKWFLVAQDAFNGVRLWQVPIRRWGWREWKNTWFSNRPADIPLNIQKRLVAVADRVYVTLGYQAPVSVLDARTGHILRTIEGSERTNEILHVNDILVLSVLVEDGVKLMSVDAASGQVRWRTETTYRGSTIDYVKTTSRYAKLPPMKLDPSLNTASDGNVIAFIDGPDVVCLDMASGTEKWRTPFPSAPADDGAGGQKTNGTLWIGTMIVVDGVVVHAGPNSMAGLSAESGEVLWKQPKKYIGHLWYEWKDVFVIDGLVWTWSAEFDTATFNIGRKRQQREFWPKTVNGYDLHTGELKKEVPLGQIFRTYHHHRCYRNKATIKYILASRRGTEFVDLREGKHTVHNWVRGTCHVGMMPANGLQYATPHPCGCYVDEKLNGMNALAPARASDAALAVSDLAGKAVRGKAFGKVEITTAGPEDWPAFRHDSMRTGAAETTVPDAIEPLWSVPLAMKLSAPIVVGDRLFAALVDEHRVVCLDAGNGDELWGFTSEGRVDSPPTYHQGTVVFGSADGGVYCLRAEDGVLVWRFQAAPGVRIMAADGQLESAWPVHGSVLVQNGLAYFSAGRSSMLDGGIRMYAVDVATGNPRYERTLWGPHYTVDNVEENFKLPMGALPDILMGDGTNVYMRTKAFNAQLESEHARPAMTLRSGFLDDTYFKRMPWNYRAGKSRDYGRLLVHDKRSVYFIRQFDSLRGLDPTVFFTPGRKGYLLFAKNLGGGRNVWSERVPIRIRAMVLTKDRLIVAGPPDVVDPADPLGAFEGRKGGALYVVDTKEGERVAEYTLPSPPVFNGAAAANGRLYLTLENGTVTCFGTP